MKPKVPLINLRISGSCAVCNFPKCGDISNLEIFATSVKTHPE